MINIKDKNLILFLQTILNKKKEYIVLEDLKKIKSLTFDSINLLDGTENKIDLSILSLFPNLEELNILNNVLTEIDLQYIKSSKISKLYLKRCTFEEDIDYSLMNYFTDLILYNSYIDDYNLLLSNLKNIVTLEIINPADENEIDISDISGNVKKLVLEKCIIKNIDYCSNFKTCEVLSLLGTYLNDSDLSFLENMMSLKKLYISEEYIYDDNLDQLKKRVDIKCNLNEYVLDEIESN